MTGASGFVCLDLDDCFVGLLFFVKNSSIYAPESLFLKNLSFASSLRFLKVKLVIFINVLYMLSVTFPRILIRS